MLIQAFGLLRANVRPGHVVCRRRRVMSLSCHVRRHDVRQSEESKESGKNKRIKHGRFVRRPQIDLLQFLESQNF